MKHKSIFETTCGRCGTHWAKEMLSNILGLHVEHPGYDEIAYNDDKNVLYPNMIVDSGEKYWEGHIYTGHVPLENLHELSKHVNIVFMVRDLRDVCVSAAYYNVYKRKVQSDFEATLKIFKRSITQSPTMFAHYLEQKDLLPHYLLRFEDLVSDPVSTLVNLLDHFDYKYDVSTVEETVANKTFKHMAQGRKIGEEDVGNHYRKGVIGDWRNHFTESENIEYMDRHGEIMEALGYCE